MPNPSPLGNHVSRNIRFGCFHADISGPELNITFFLQKKSTVKYSRPKSPRRKGRAGRLYRHSGYIPKIDLVRNNRVQKFFFIPDGDGFRLGCPGGDLVRLPKIKGLEHIFEVVRKSGQEIHVADLVSPRGYAAISAILHLSRDEVLDDRALKEYDASLADYEQRIKQAELENDQEAVQRLKKLRTEVLAKKKAAVNLHRRKRVMNDPLEKMRKRVCNAISRALKKIRKQSEVLWKHLVRLLNRGMTICCREEPGVVWYTGSPI